MWGATSGQGRNWVRTMHKRTWVAVVFLVIAGGCQPTVEKRLNVIALVDYSGSVTKSDLTRYGTLLAKDILRSLRAGDRFAVYPLDEAAAFRDEMIARVDLRDTVFWVLGDGVTHREDSARVRLLRYVATEADLLISALQKASVNRRVFSGNTDIVGALNRVATRIERSSKPTVGERIAGVLMGKRLAVTQNVIVVCSDMINESSDISFAKRVPTIVETDAIISNLRAKKLLPDLSDVTILVLGRTGRNSQQVSAIEAFWAKYFRETGATLRLYDYDPAGRIGAILETI